MQVRSRVPLALLLGWWALVYLPPLLAGRTLPARDLAATHVPWRTVWAEQVLAGSVPLWDPLSNGGRPLLANPNAMAVYPGTALFLALAPERAAAWHVALHHLLLLLGAYRVARRAGAGREAAALAAAGVGTLGLAWSAATFLNSQAALAWAFWALATAPGRPPTRAAALRRALAGGGLLGLAFLAGEPVTAALAGLAWMSVAASEWRRESALAAAPLAAAAVAVPVLAPLLASWQDSARGVLGVGPGALSADALGIHRLPELLLPHLLGSPLGDAASGFWAAPSFPWLRYYPVIFVGALPLMVLPFARRALRPWWWLVAGGLVGAGLLAIPALAMAAADLPLAGGLRFGIKLLVLSALALPPLLALGWERAGARRRTAGALMLLAVIALAPLGLLPGRALRPLLNASYPESSATLARVEDRVLRRAVLLDLTALALPAAALLVAPAMPAVALVAVLAGGTIGGRDVLAFDDAQRWAKPPAALAAAVTPARLAVFAAAADPADAAGAAELQRFWAMRAALVPGYATRWGAAYVIGRGPDGLEPVRAELLAAASTRLPLGDRARLAAALGASSVVSAEPIPGHDGDLVDGIWVTSLAAAPPAYLATRLLRASGPDAVMRTLAAPGFRAGADAVVEQGESVDAGDGRLAELSGRPHDRRFEAELSGAGMLVVGQSYVRGWRAEVDGAPVRVEPVNGAQLGVHVPAGRHTIRLALDRTPYAAGALGPLLFALAWLLTRRRASADRAAASGAPARTTPATPPAP